MDNLRKCCDCNIKKPIPEFRKGEWRCKVCAWKKSNNYKIEDGWSSEQYDIILDKIINIKIKYINELIGLLDKELYDIIYILKTQLKIANKPLEILWKCDWCDKEFMIRPCKFISNENMFCTHKCYGEHKKENILRGEKNPQYNRIKTNCTNCNKEINVIPHDFKIKNKHGDNHNFCSHECYWEYRKVYYVGEKSVMHNYIYTKQQIKKSRKRMVKMYENGLFDRETKPQKITNTILDNLQIKYIREKGYKYYSVDNYLPDYNLIIEVMGDYFHSNPNKYHDFKSLNDMQKKGVKRDKSKRTYLYKYYNVNVLYLWETDINKNPNLCKELIKLYIKNNGELKNYNSFNYYLDKYNKLHLKNKIINPYYEKSK